MPFLFSILQIPVVCWKPLKDLQLESTQPLLLGARMSDCRPMYVFGDSFCIPKGGDEGETCSEPSLSFGSVHSHSRFLVVTIMKEYFFAGLSKAAGLLPDVQPFLHTIIMAPLAALRLALIMASIVPLCSSSLLCPANQSAKLCRGLSSAEV